jgi:hypothetical protein
MTDQTISCPQCGTIIPLTDALTEKIKHQLEEKMQREIQKKEKEIRNKERVLEEKQEHMEKEVKEKLFAEKQKMWVLAQEKAMEKVEIELKDLAKMNKEKEDQLKNMREQELLLRKKQREAEEKEKNLLLEVERKLDVERKNISEQAKNDAREEMHLKFSEKEKQMEQMRKTIEDLKRKSEQGSMQIQGDVQENDLIKMLQNEFINDKIEDVPTGIRGADLIHTVYTPFQKKAGTLLWESKNTKAWSNAWVQKLKDDQVAAKADICILVSQVVPEHIVNFGYQDGVWICQYSFAIPLANALRIHTIQAYHIKQSLVGKDQKMELLYAYLSGNEFKTRIENIVSAFTNMKADLDSEKRALQRIWNKREKEIERVILNTSGMYGDIQGISGSSLSHIPALELPEGIEEI